MDWLENLMGLGIHSADSIIPELQGIKVGDAVRLAPEGSFDLYLEAAIVEPARALVLRTPGDPAANMEAGYPDATWAFVLEELDDRTTRLIARWRADYKPTLAGMVWNHYGLEPIHFLMERKMLLGIKERAERGES